MTTSHFTREQTRTFEAAQEHLAHVLGAAADPTAVRNELTLFVPAQNEDKAREQANALMRDMETGGFLVYDGEGRGESYLMTVPMG